jgi:hypothetical protein
MRNWMSRLAGPWSGRREVRPPCRPALEVLEDRCVPDAGLSQAALAADSANQAFVAQVYQDLLQRPVDSAALSYWTTQLDYGVPGTALVTALEASDEYHTVEINQFYVQLLHRPVDPDGLAYFGALLDNGGTLQQVEAQILGSDEYFLEHGGTNAGFMEALYQDTLNRPVDAMGAETYGTLVDWGVPRNSIALSVLSSPEFATDQLTSLFNQYLGQPPSPGMDNTFLLQLQAGMLDSVVADIIGSNEFFAQLS